MNIPKTLEQSMFQKDQTKPMETSGDAQMYHIAMVKQEKTLSNSAKADNPYRNNQNNVPEFPWLKLLKLLEWKP